MTKVTLRLGDLLDAASKLGPLRPRGFRGVISRTTEIKPDAHGVVVETAFIETSVAADGVWKEVVSVDGRRLHEVLKLLARQWADIGGADARIDLTATPKAFTLSWSGPKGARSQSLPRLPSA